MTNPKDTLLNLADQALTIAKNAGATAADVVIQEATSIECRCRLGELEHLEHAASRDLGLRVFVAAKEGDSDGNRVATVSTNDVGLDALQELAEKAVIIAKAAPVDPYARLANKEEYAQKIPDLQLDGGALPSADALRDTALQTEAAARAVNGITNSEGAEASASRSTVCFATSEGFSAAYTSTGASLMTSVLAGEGTAMVRDYDYASAISWGALPGAATIGAKAGENAVKRLNPKPGKTGKFPVIFDPRAGSGILRAFLGAINGRGIARGTSFLQEAMGTAVFSSNITIMDDPLKLAGLRSQPVDGEGIAGTSLELVKDGVLNHWLLDLATAKQLGLQTNGRASRGIGGSPSPSATNAYIVGGDVAPADLYVDVADGLYVLETMGMGVNGITGDYSLGASGFWIENGELTHPVDEATIAGRLQDVFKDVRVASDLEFKTGIDVPTLRTDSLTVAA